MTHDIDNSGTVFSHQPLDASPPDHNDAYWVSGVIPRVLQFGSTVIAMHNPEDLVEFAFRNMNMTHAHFKWDIMDEVNDDLQASHWIFARQGDTYSK